MHSIFDKEALTKRAKDHKIQPFRVKQIYQEIFKNFEISFDAMTALSKDLREDLKKDFEIIPFKNIEIIEGPKTTKFMFDVGEGKIIESIAMYHYHIVDGQRKLNRITLCISTQVGCPVGCVFCVTGKLGFGKNLGYDEIVGQVLYVNNYIKAKLGKKEDGTRNSIRNIVFMGMGEPLLNYDNLKVTLHYLLDQSAFSLSKRHVTISTSGVIPGIQRLIDDGIDVKLALSLHAPNQELRQELIPTIGKVYTLEKLMAVIDAYTDATGNRIFYEYIMIKDKTDSPELAHQLGKLLMYRSAHLNLIPYNENPVIELEESTRDTIETFRKIVETYEVTLTVRDTMGRKIQGACGQLGYDKAKNKEKYVIQRKQ